MTTRETWILLEEGGGFYSVSNFGRIKSHKRFGVHKHDIILKPYDNGNGYKYVSIRKKKYYVHRLVAKYFIPNPNGFPLINHKDEDKSNNRADNLEWCNAKYNLFYGTGMERRRKTRISNGNNRAINVYDLKGNLLRQYSCAYHMEKDGISRRAAYLVCSGRARRWRGMVFRYAEEPFSYEEKIPYKGKAPIYKYDLNNNLVAVYESTISAERENGLNRNRIYSASYRKTIAPIINGYKYSYKPL